MADFVRRELDGQPEPITITLVHRQKVKPLKIPLQPVLPEGKLAEVREKHQLNMPAFQPLHF